MRYLPGILLPITVVAARAEPQHWQHRLREAGVRSRTAPWTVDIVLEGHSDGPMVAGPPSCYFPWPQREWNMSELSIANRRRDS